MREKKEGGGGDEGEEGERRESIPSGLCSNTCADVYSTGSYPGKSSIHDTKASVRVSPLFFFTSVYILVQSLVGVSPSLGTASQRQSR